MVPHADRARRENRHVGAALLLELDLGRFDPLADFIIRDIEVRARRQKRRIGIQPGKLRLSVISQLLRFGRVVAVAIDNHEVFLSVRSCSRGRASLVRVF